MKTVLLAVIMVLLQIACSFTSAYAETYYVSPAGSDNSSGSANAPWLTLQQAANSVVAGDVLVIESGTYAGFRAQSGGSEGAPITFRAASDATVVINSVGPDNRKGSIVEIEGYDWWVLEGFEVTGARGNAGIDIRLADYVTVSRCFCHHNEKWGIFTAFADRFTAEYNECSFSILEHGIYHSNSGDFAVLRYNSCHHNRAGGIQINADPSMGGDGISSGNLVTHNVLYENGEAGGAAINLASVRDTLIANNLIYSNHAGGIAAWDDGQGYEWGCKNNRIFNNTVHMPSDGRWALNLINGSTGCSVFNNIFINEHSYRGGIEIDSSSLSGFSCNYNLFDRVSVEEEVLSLSEWQSSYGQDVQSITQSASETFVTPGVDYHLLFTASARDSGIALNEVTDDLDGRSRPQGTGYDLGVYEYIDAPKPDIKANGSGHNVSLFKGESTSISVEFDPGNQNGTDSDWWLVEVTPDGTFHYFDLVGGIMTRGLLPTHQGPLFELNATFIMEFRPTKPGTYTFYFAVDLIRNAQVDFDSLFFDGVVVSVSEATGPGYVTYSLWDGHVYRIEAKPGAEPEDVSKALDLLSPLPAGAKDSLLNVSPDGQWMILETERFDSDCVGWACLAVVAEDFSSGVALRTSRGVIHPEGFSAIANGGGLVVFPGSGAGQGHSRDLWVTSRSDTGWSEPVPISMASPFAFNDSPAMNAAGTKVLFDCTDEPYTETTGICEVGTDGIGFRRVAGPGDSPTGQQNSGSLHHADYGPSDEIVFEASWGAETLWRLNGTDPDPARIGQFNNDNSPCVLSSGHIASLWLNRPEGAGDHELKIMAPDGNSYFMSLTDIDVADVGIGCGG